MILSAIVIIFFWLCLMNMNAKFFCPLLIISYLTCGVCLTYFEVKHHLLDQCDIWFPRFFDITCIKKNLFKCFLANSILFIMYFWGFNKNIYIFRLKYRWILNINRLLCQDFCAWPIHRTHQSQLIHCCFCLWFWILCLTLWDQPTSK